MNIIFDPRGMKYICAMILLCVCVCTHLIFNKKIKFNKSRENGLVDLVLALAVEATNKKSRN